MRINKEKGYAILWLHNAGKSENDIAEELGLSTKQIKNFLKNQNTETSSLPIKTSPVSSKTEDLMIMETSVKKNKSVAIMTQAASERNDAMRSKLINGNKNKSKDHIFKPR